jgi:hypothetical protein
VRKRNIDPNNREHRWLICYRFTSLCLLTPLDFEAIDLLPLACRFVGCSDLRNEVFQLCLENPSVIDLKEEEYFRLLSQPNASNTSA